MTRSDADAKSMKIRPSRRRASLRSLLALPLAMGLLAAFSASALAAEPAAPTTGYTHTATTKTEVVKPSSGTAPSKESTTPQKETAPSKTSTTPAESTSTPTTSPAKESSLPFTGLNLSWVVGFGLVLIAAGGSIVMVQRRQHGSGRR